MEKFPIEAGRIPFSGLCDTCKYCKYRQLVSEERNPKPLKLFLKITSACRSLRLPKLGIDPVNKLVFMSKMVSLEALVIELGIGPLSLFELKRSTSRLKSEFPKSEERIPENSLHESSKNFKVDKLNMEDGMNPYKEFSNTLKYWRIGRVPISCGNSPAIYRHASINNIECILLIKNIK